MTFLRIGHVQVAMPRGREGEARAFYAEVLGMTEVPKPAALARRGGCWFTAGEVVLHLGVESEFRPARKAHPALLVSDLDEIRGRLENHGIECRDDEPLDGYHRIFVSDPFGNRIELMQALDPFVLSPPAGG